MNSFQKVVTQGMKRICADFSPILDRRGFVHPKGRLWVRLNAHCAETVYFHRLGSTYGAPRTASIDIRIMLDIHVLNDPSPGSGIGIISDHARRQTGYAYHHRFNADTWSTYDRCLEELEFYVAEVGEPWFSEWRDPQRLLTHPELRPPARERLEEAISGRTNAENVAASLKGLGVKIRRSNPATHRSE